MAKKSVKPGVTEVDPMFFIPEGVDELVHKDTVLFEELSEEDRESGEDFGGDYAEGEEDSEDDLDTPEVLGIVSQKLRRAPGGIQVVDVVVEIAEVEGSTNYEFRIVKI